MKKNSTYLFIGIAILAYFLFKDKLMPGKEETEPEPGETEKPVKLPGSAATVIKSQPAAPVKPAAVTPVKVTTVKNATILTAPIIKKSAVRSASVPSKFINLKTGL